jgi:hypothetical protein
MRSAFAGSTVRFTTEPLSLTEALRSARSRFADHGEVAGVRTDVHPVTLTRRAADRVRAEPSGRRMVRSLLGRRLAPRRAQSMVDHACSMKSALKHDSWGSSLVGQRIARSRCCYRVPGLRDSALNQPYGKHPGFPHDSCSLSLSLSLSLLTSASALAAPTSLPFTEHFGTGYSTSGCASQWAGGECENGWIAFGDNRSLELMVGPGSDVGLMIVPHSGSVNANGVTRRFYVTPGEQLVAGGDLVVVEPSGGDVEVGIQFKFRNSSGTLIGTKHKSFTVDLVHTISMTEIVPSGAATVDIAYGVNNASKAGIETFWSLMPVLSTPIAGDECVEEACPSCNVTCTYPEILITDCDQTGEPSCTTIFTCECVDQGDLESEAQDEGLYSSF